MNGQTAAPRFAIVSTLDDFDALKEDWTKLYENHGKDTQLFQTYNWNWHWLHQFKDNRPDIQILTGYIDDELVLVIPLILTRPLGIKILQWMGAPVSQYGDILIKNDANNLKWLQKAFTHLNNTIKPDLYYLRKTRFDAPITPMLESYGASVIEEMAAPYIELHGAENFNEFNKRYSQRSRKSKRRHRRKLEEQGEVQFNIFKESKEATRASLLAINLKRQWLKKLDIFSPAFQGHTIERFFESAASSETHPVNIRASELCVDDRPAAIEIGIVAKNRYGAHLGAYNEAFIQHSPGSLQMQDTIAALIDEGIVTIDLFAPGDSYKFEWTDQSTPVFDFAYPLTIKGNIYQYLYLQLLRPGLKRASPYVKKAQKLLRK